jgi:hypothetical protein
MKKAIGFHELAINVKVGVWRATDDAEIMQSGRWELCRVFCREGTVRTHFGRESAPPALSNPALSNLALSNPTPTLNAVTQM